MVVPVRVELLVRSADRCSFGYEELARADGFVTEIDCSAELALDPLDAP